jgi:hypothetical protein
MHQTGKNELNCSNARRQRRRLKPIQRTIEKRDVEANLAGRPDRSGSVERTWMGRAVPRRSRTSDGLAARFLLPLRVIAGPPAAPLLQQLLSQHVVLRNLAALKIVRTKAERRFNRTLSPSVSHGDERYSRLPGSFASLSAKRQDANSSEAAYPASGVASKQASSAAGPGYTAMHLPPRRLFSVNPPHSTPIVRIPAFVAA